MGPTERVLWAATRSLLLRVSGCIVGHFGAVTQETPLLREHDGRATAELVCAGHPLPLLASDGQVRPVGAFSPMLGAQPVEDWFRRTVELEPGDVLVLYTDGVFDTVGETGRFGEDRLQRTVAGVRDAADAVARIDAALSAFESGAQADDTAILAVERVAVVAPAAPAGGNSHHEERRA